MTSQTNLSDFFERTRGARKVMVFDLGFLGDSVHLLPALWMLRQAYPEVQLHVTVAAHITSLLECAPWVNKVWGYTRFPKHASLRENLQMVTALRREKFDVVINLNGSDRSSWLTFLSGARERLGRMPGEKTPPFWKHLFTAHVFHPFKVEPLYLQRCHCLEKAGFPFIAPEFHVTIKPDFLQAAGISESEAGSYFHIGPFTTADRKELSPDQLRELVAALQKNFPQKRLVFSCAPTAREQTKLKELLATLPQRPWRVFPGNLRIPELAAVIQNSALHFSGDTGPMHLAAMTRTPLVAWFWPNPGRQQWIPVGEQFHVIVGTNKSNQPYLHDISTGDLIRAAQSILAASPGTNYPATWKAQP